MRLLNINTIRLEEYFGRSIPKYAILSHTWGKEEVTFQDLDRNPNLKDLTGWAKVEGAMAMARKRDLAYVWIDTCCIDKSSSAELSEAINSMFEWYLNSEICFAFLDDILVDTSKNKPPAGFPRSRWFTRGWTLQEFLAPREVDFFDAKWVLFGSKRSLAVQLHGITKIDDECITYSYAIFERSLATRMSWAAARQTTRVEDEAYCLLGILGVNMPLLYGEGERAFVRLQEEALRQSEDDSLLAWGLGVDPPVEFSSSLLAPSPAYFARCQGVATPDPTSPPRFGEHEDKVNHSWSPLAMTSRGLGISLPLIECSSLPSIVFGVLESSRHCRIRGMYDHQSILIVLFLVTPTRNTYQRMPETRPFTISSSTERALRAQGLQRRSIYIQRMGYEDGLFPLILGGAHVLRNPCFYTIFDDESVISLRSRGYSAEETYPPHAIYDFKRGAHELQGGPVFYLFRHPDTSKIVVCVREDPRLRPTDQGSISVGIDTLQDSPNGLWDYIFEASQHRFTVRLGRGDIGARVLAAAQSMTATSVEVGGESWTVNAIRRQIEGERRGDTQNWSICISVQERINR